MATISLCMIIKNEEGNLARCLNSIYDLMDEIIIVDTGSTDKSKEIAAQFTNQIFDFAWIQDFSAARNYAFSKATCDYIYSADADEVLDTENHEKFRLMKDNIHPEIEIVQMFYGNQLLNGSVYNFDKELRPKLFRRLRTFTWIDPVHETIRLNPVVFDSDIIITHLQKENHANRDLAIFERHIQGEHFLSTRLNTMYAKELLISDNQEAMLRAEDYFTSIADGEHTSPEELKEALCVIVKASRQRGDYLKMFQYALKDIADQPVSEICCELGDYYFKQGHFKEATIWYYNAAYETQAILNIHAGGDIPRNKLADCYKELGDWQQESVYHVEASKWLEEMDLDFEK